LEKDVPDGYQVTISQNETTFVITNIYQNSVPEIPNTGGTSPLWLYIVMMRVSGLMLVILGAGGMRGRCNENKK